MIMKDIKDYVKVVYESDPIGKEKIVLILTSFDIDRYNNDLIEVKQHIGIERTNFNAPNELEYLQATLNQYVKNYYEPFIKEL